MRDQNIIFGYTPLLKIRKIENGQSTNSDDFFYYN